MISAAAPTNYTNLRPYRNYYTLGEIGEFKHRFEVFFTAQYQYVLMLRGNTPEEMAPYPCSGVRVMPAPLVPGAEEPYIGSPKIVDGEPKSFKNVSAISENLNPLADAVDRFMRQKWNATEVKIRYDGCKRQITLQEFIMLGKNERRQDFKSCQMTGLHQAGTDIIEAEGTAASAIGEGFMYKTNNHRFISFSPADNVQGRILLNGHRKNPAFMPEWKRFSKIVVDMIEKNVCLPFPEVPATFKQYVFFEVKCIGRKCLTDTRKGIPFMFFQDDEASKLVKFEFEISEALQKTIIHTKDVASLNLKIMVTLHLKEMKLDLQVTGIKKEHVETIKFKGKIGTFEGQPVLESTLNAVIDANETVEKKRRRDRMNAVQIMDGEKYEYIDVYPGNLITPQGF